MSSLTTERLQELRDYTEHQLVQAMASELLELRGNQDTVRIDGMERDVCFIRATRDGDWFVDGQRAKTLREAVDMALGEK